MTMLHATNGVWRTVVHNRQILTNRKWKFLYITLPLLVAGNVVAMESNRSTSEHSRRQSLSSVTSLDEGMNSKSIERCGKEENLRALLDESQNSSSIRAEPSESPKKVSEYELIISELKRELEEKDKLINKLLNKQKNAIKQRIPMDIHELSRLPKKNVRITEHSGDDGDIIYTLIIGGKIFGESTNEEDLYREFFSYYNISMPTSLKEKFNAFLEFKLEERAKHINKKQNDTVIGEIEKCEEYHKRLMRIHRQTK